jgi:hypothetical protein
LLGKEGAWGIFYSVSSEEPKKRASKALANLPKDDYQKVRDGIRELAENPRPSDWQEEKVGEFGLEFIELFMGSMIQKRRWLFLILGIESIFTAKYKQSSLTISEQKHSLIQLDKAEANS